MFRLTFVYRLSHFKNKFKYIAILGSSVGKGVHNQIQKLWRLKFGLNH